MVDRALALAIAAELCKKFEGFYSKPYLCPALVCTIGFGTTVYPNGRRVTLKDPAITRAQATEFLVHQLETIYLPAVLKLCPDIDNFARLAAIVDFCYNLGAGNLGASTLRRRSNEGRWHDVPKELLRWNRGGGRVLRGLTLRRQTEATLI